MKSLSFCSLQRPFALNGTFTANLFCHYELTGQRVDVEGNYYGNDAPHNGLAPYVVAGSPEEAVWRQEHPDGWHYQDPRWYLDDENPENWEDDTNEVEEEGEGDDYYDKGEL